MNDEGKSSDTSRAPITTSDFTVVETKSQTADYSTIRQIAIVKYVDRIPFEKLDTRINPDREEDSPALEDCAEKIFNLLNGEIVIAYGPFAKRTIEESFKKANKKGPIANWIDGMKVVRNTWEDFRYTGYELPSVAEHFELRYHPDSCLQMTKVIGTIFIKALEKKPQFTPEAWVVFTKDGIISRRGSRSETKTTP